mgnify:CR=1 FL=1
MQNSHKHAILAFASFFLSFFSFYTYYAKLYAGDALSCGTNCDIVQASAYGQLFGVPVSFIGGIMFFMQGILMVVHLVSHHHMARALINVSFIIAPIMAIGFIGIQAFVLHAWCKTCVVVDVGAALSAALYWAWRPCQGTR